PMAASLSPLVARDIVFSYRDHSVLDGVDLVAAPGQRVGLVGENGAGKSTLLRILAGELRPGSGSVDAPADLTSLPQEPPFDAAATVGEVLDRALAPLHRAVTALETLGARMADDPDAAREFAQTLEWAERHDAWDADRRAAVAAQRLGVADLARERTA